MGCAIATVMSDGYDRYVKFPVRGFVPAPTPYRRPGPTPQPVSLEHETIALEFVERSRGLRENATGTFVSWHADRTAVEYFGTLLAGRGRLESSTRKALTDELTLLRKQTDPIDTVAPPSATPGRDRTPKSKVEDPRLAEAQAFDVLDDLAGIQRRAGAISADQDQAVAEYGLRGRLLHDLAPLSPDTKRRLRAALRELGLLEERTAATGTSTGFWTSTVTPAESLEAASLEGSLEDVGDEDLEPAVVVDDRPIPILTVTPSWRSEVAAVHRDVTVDEEGTTEVAASLEAQTTDVVRADDVAALVDTAGNDAKTWTSQVAMPPVEPMRPGESFEFAEPRCVTEPLRRREPAPSSGGRGRRWLRTLLRR